MSANFRDRTLAATQLPSDQSYSAYRKAAGILEKEFVKYPGHPGIAHYLIHSYDAQPLAEQGIAAARRYAQIAPDAPHALHMPSHIFTRVGGWADSVATNRRSATVAEKNNEPGEALHALDYMTYAYLQLARDRDARKTLDEAGTLTGIKPGTAIAPYALAAMPARYAIERGAWGEAMGLVPIASNYPFIEAMTLDEIHHNVWVTLPEVWPALKGMDANNVGMAKRFERDNFTIRALFVGAPLFFTECFGIDGRKLQREDFSISSDLV